MIVRPRSFSSAVCACVLALGLATSASSQAKSYRDDARVRAFAQQWALEHHQTFASVWGVLRQAQKRPDIIRLMQPSTMAATKNWASYRSRFVTDHRIARGVAFWQQHARALQRAETTYGVDAHIIVGILGAETIFGQFKGKVRTLDALTTLAFDFPNEHPKSDSRSAYFLGELGALLTLSRQQATHTKQWRGSYAGALGYPQFMPSSWLRWGVDFDQDGRIDLINSADDAIGSVAHYLADHGWQRGLPARWATQVAAAPSDALAAALAPDILPTLTPQSLAAAGAQLPEELPSPVPALALVELRNGEQAEPTYVIGSPNFYAITRYNQSSYYALAVIELGEAIAQARQTPSDAPAAGSGPGG